MIFNLTAKLIIIILQIIPKKIDFQAKLVRQRFDKNAPTNVLEKCIFNCFNLVLFFKLAYAFLFVDYFRDRVYYLYEHPDHDDPLWFLKRRHPYMTKWIIHSFPKLKHFWRSCMRFSRYMKSLVPTYKSSPSFFGISPKLAVVVHGAGEWAEDLQIRNGCVHGSFFPSQFKFLPFLSRYIGLSEYITRQVSNVAGIAKPIVPNSSQCSLSIYPSLAQVLIWNRCTKNGGSSPSQ